GGGKGTTPKRARLVPRHYAVCADAVDAGPLRNWPGSLLRAFDSGQEELDHHRQSRRESRDLLQSFAGRGQGRDGGRGNSRAHEEPATLLCAYVPEGVQSARVLSKDRGLC